MRLGDRVSTQEDTDDEGIVTVTGVITEVLPEGEFLIRLETPLFTFLGEKWHLVRALEELELLVEEANWRQCGF